MAGAVTAPVRKAVGQELVDAAESAASVRVGIGSYDAAGSLGLRVVIIGELPSADRALGPVGQDGDHRQRSFRT